MPSNVPADYWAPNATGRWWSDPDRSGHGPFDLLTPPLAAALLDANASATLCPALSGLLRAAQGNLSELCEASGVCGELSSGLDELAGVLEAAGGPALDVCDDCSELLESACVWGLPGVLGWLGRGGGEGCRKAVYSVSPLTLVDPPLRRVPAPAVGL